ncbi:MAG TPA: carboxyl transferase domain-containing protein [Solirubrobacterales bacterium]|jgi:acetyl-CoA carboxylase carboxyltransferase component|nr:carboxyl transferase domain-containing protein [Solirubrobacterales bacterium]
MSDEGRSVERPGGESALAALSARARAGGDRSRLGTKLPVRERLALLLDPGSFVEDGLLAASREGLPADAVLTGSGRVGGREVLVVAHDPTVKAGSWGRLSVEKQIRALERADRDLLPVFYLVDSAGGRLTDQLGFHPGHRGAARVFHLQVRLSGRVPQVCCLLGPSAAGGAYMPAFCDWVGMVDGNASMYLASPRVAQKAIGENVTLEEMGGARMHTSVSGCGDQLFAFDAEAIAAAKRFFSYLPGSWEERPAPSAATPPASSDWEGVLPASARTPYDVREVVARVADAESFFEIKADWAGEMVVGLARIDGAAVGIVANQPLVRSGAINVDSADKAARFIALCDSFNLPLLFLCDTPGFMIGSAVERRGIIRHGAKMVAAMASAEVPRFCIVLRKAFAAGYYAMSCPGFEPRSTIALEGAQIGAMAGEAAVNAVWANRIEAIEDPEARRAFIAERAAGLDEELEATRLASELLIEAVIEPPELRGELERRLAAAAGWARRPPGRHHAAFPV